MPNKKLNIVADVGTHTVLQYEGPKDKPVIKGEGAGRGNWDYLCGNCSAVLCAHIPEYLTGYKGGGNQNILITCPACGSHNELPRTA